MIESVAEEVFGETSRLYPDLRAIAVNFMAEHYKKVERTEGMKRVTEIMMEDEIPLAGMIMGEVLNEFAKLKK